MAESLGGTVTPLTFNGDDTSSQGQGESQTFTWGVLDVEEKEDTVAYLSTLLSQEVKLYPPCPDYLSNLSSLSVSADSDPVSESWRRKLCEWCFEVVDHFKVSE